jgi:hypothetical protein
MQWESKCIWKEHAVWMRKEMKRRERRREVRLRREREKERESQVGERGRAEPQA